jgi:hypothetical protein
MKLNIPVVVFEQMEGNKDGITTVFHNDALAIRGAKYTNSSAIMMLQRLLGMN